MSCQFIRFLTSRLFRFSSPWLVRVRVRVGPCWLILVLVIACEVCLRSKRFTMLMPGRLLCTIKFFVLMYACEARLRGEVV